MACCEVVVNAFVTDKRRKVMMTLTVEGNILVVLFLVGQCISFVILECNDIDVRKNLYYGEIESIIISAAFHNTLSKR